MIADLDEMSKADQISLSIVQRLTLYTVNSNTLYALSCSRGKEDWSIGSPETYHILPRLAYSFVNIIY